MIEEFVNQRLFKLKGLKIMDFKNEPDPEFPDVDATFSSSENIEILRNSMWEIPDGHVMAETLNYKDQYTGERYYDFE